VVTEAEIIEFAKFFDPLPIHVDPDAAKASRFGGVTASGSHMLAIRQKLVSRFGLESGIIASLGYEEVRFLAPLRGGQSCVVELEFLDKRESRSKPDQGIATLGITLLADDQPVLKLRDIGLMHRRPAGD
jgi:acyl dehydratase